MKRRIISLFISLVLVLGMLPGGNVVTAAESANSSTSLSNSCPCGCGVELENVSWKVYDPNAGKVDNGHYYLDGNYAQKAQHNVLSGNSVVLDLRGYTLTTEKYNRLYRVEGYLAVLDSVGGGKLCAKTAGNAYGGVIMMSADSGKAVFELYSGTLTADKDNKGSRRGGLISVGKNSTFHMYDGIVMNGTSLGEEAEAGGCIAATAATSLIQIEGGKVIGGYAPGFGGNIYCTGGTTILRNCEIIGGRSDSDGGNIYQDGGNLTIENCVISHGSALGDNGGGNVNAYYKAKVVIRNSTIRNGYAAKQGGNVYLGSGTQTIEDTTMEAGVCGTYGGNLRITSNSVTTLNNCTITGDVCSTGSLTLQGTTKIGLNNNGLNLIYNGATTAISASGLTDGAEIFVNADALFTEAGANAAYFKPALRTVITETADGLVGTQAEDGAIGGYCPHCYDSANPTKVVWKAFSTTDSLMTECYLDSASDTDGACTGKHIATGHYYLTQDYTDFSTMYAGVVQGDKTADANVVVDLAGYSITASPRAFLVRSKGTLSLLDSVGGAVVSGCGQAEKNAGVLYNEGGKLNIYGGKYIFTSGIAMTNGGIIYNTGTLSVYGGSFDASAYSRTSYNGGVIYTASNGKLNVTAGYFKGGKAKTGGVLYIGANCAVNIKGGQFTGGRAASYGGNINVVGTSSSKTGTILISGVSITDGNSDAYTGNIQITYYKTVQVKDTYIARGNAKTYAGNINVPVNSTFIDYKDSIITDGNAGTSGGNVYASNTGARIRFTDCMIIGGSAVERGGNMTIHHGYAQVVSGVITGGITQGSGGNIYTNVGNYETGENHYLSLDGGVQITGGIAKLGGNAYFGGIVKLTHAFIHGGKATENGHDIYLAKGTRRNVLTVGENSTGNASMYIQPELMGTPVYGNCVDGTVASKLNMVITLEGNYGQPHLCVRDGKLAVPGVLLVGDGISAGYANATDAAADCKEGQYIKLYIDAAMNLTGDVTVDLNGHMATVSGIGTFYGMDSTGNGRAMCDGNVNIAEINNAPDGNTYVAITEGTEVTYHALDMAITGVAIRPSVSGIYYTGTWNCDDLLKEQIASYGVAVDMVSAPDGNFKASESTLYTAFDTASFVSGENKTGAIISNILDKERNADLNDAYGRMPIFAATYVTLKSGTTIVGTGVGYSMYSAMQELEKVIKQNPTTSRDVLERAMDFYTEWKDSGMGSWDFRYISGAYDPETDVHMLDKKKVIVLGNSYVFYGKTLLNVGNTKPYLNQRLNDKGYFYQLCKEMGADVSVTNWTFGSHGVKSLFQESCKYCSIDHRTYLEDRYYDYVVVSPGSEADFKNTMEMVMAFFREANPNVKFVILGNHAPYGYTNYDGMAYIADTYVPFEEQGVIIADWGGLFNDIVTGQCAVPGATQEYIRGTFLVAKDNYHPNLLTGYLEAMMLYCAITGESAVGLPYSFWCDTERSTAFDVNAFLNSYYADATTNFCDVFNSESDMNGLQQLVDKYLTEKPYQTRNSQ